MGFDLDYHLRDRPGWITKFFKEIDGYCLGLKIGVKRACLKTYVRYTINGKMFCRIFVTSKNLRVYLKIDYSKLEKTPTYIRDYSGIARTKDTVELLFKSEKGYLQDGTTLFAVTCGLIEKSFIGVSTGKTLTKPVKPTKEEPPIVDKTLSMRLTAEGDCINISIRVPKGQLNKVLDKVLDYLLGE